jgi:CysZ protein
VLLQALGQSVRLLGDAVFWRTAVKGVLLALPLAGLAAWVGIALVGALPEIRIGWLDALVHALGVVAAVLLALLLFPALASLLVGLFLDDVAAATERRFYPGDPPGSAVGVAESLRQGAALAGRMAGVNLLALPLFGSYSTSSSAQ